MLSRSDLWSRVVVLRVAVDDVDNGVMGAMYVGEMMSLEVLMQTSRCGRAKTGML